MPLKKPVAAFTALSTGAPQTFQQVMRTGTCCESGTRSSHRTPEKKAIILKLELVRKFYK